MLDATKDYKNNPSFTRDVVQFILTEKNDNRRRRRFPNLRTFFFPPLSEIEPAAPDIIFEPLIITSPNAAYLDVSAVYQNVNPGDILRSFRSDNTPKVIAAKIKSGRADRPFELIAVGDSDFLYDSFWTSSVKLLDGNFAVPVMDNGNFVLNALESLSGGDNLIACAANRPRSDDLKTSKESGATRSLTLRLKRTKHRTHQSNQNRTSGNLGQKRLRTAADLYCGRIVPDCRHSQTSGCRKKRTRRNPPHA